VSKLARKITSDEELDAKINRGVEAVYTVSKAAYGPGAGNAILELPYGDPIISRDGVTNVEKVILEIIDLISDKNRSCILIFSTNDEYSDIWTVLDKVMDFSSDAVENPNSDRDVKLWIKYTN